MPALAAIAPALGAALARKGLDVLGGFFGAATAEGASRISRMIEESTGIRVNEIVDDKLNDDQWVRLKEFEAQHEELLLREMEAANAHEIARAELANASTIDARNRQADAQRSDDWLTRNFVHVFAIILTCLTFGFIYFVVTVDGLYTEGPTGTLTAAAQAKAGTVDTVLGFLLGVTLSAVVQFFYGSSQGSTDKHRMIERMVGRGAGEPEGGR